MLINTFFHAGMLLSHKNKSKGRIFPFKLNLKIELKIDLIEFLYISMIFISSNNAYWDALGDVSVYHSPKSRCASFLYPATCLHSF